MEIWRSLCLVFEILTINLASLASASAFVSRRGRSDVGVYVRGIATAIGVITIFPLILIPLAMWRDWPAVISVVGIVWGIFTLWFAFTVMAPLGLLITALSGEETRTRNPKTGTEEGFGERYVRFILTMLFVELAFVWYFSIFEVSNYRGMVPTLVVALILILLGGATWFKRVSIAGAVITVVVMTFAFAFPENFEYWKAKNEVRAQAVSLETFCLRNPLVSQCLEQDQKKQAVAIGQGIPAVSVKDNERLFRVALKGPNTLSDSININQLPRGWRCDMEGPISTRARFDDGTEGPITQDFGVKGGKVGFLGPAGAIAAYRCYPPSARM